MPTAADYFLVPPGGQLIPITLSSAVAEGGAGTIHRIVGQAGWLAKLYKDPNELPEYEQKIAAMLLRPPQLPPFSVGGRSFVQIAWPSAAVLNKRQKFVGFAMPEVDFQQSTELENILQKTARRRKRLPEFYGNRVLLAANLATLMAALHALGHFMIDMKPMNMRFYPSRFSMAILDTDGFSIQGSQRWPARLFSDEYIAPEARSMRPESLGLHQDLFALAVIIFRLLNNGIHPYQGIDRQNSSHPTALQDRINAGLYAYARSGQSGAKPSRASILDQLEDSTRDLFDRAFGRHPDLRPPAQEWAHHLQSLVSSLVPCRKKPNEHAHFSRGCGLCALEHRGPAVATTTARAVSPTYLPKLAPSTFAPPALTRIAVPTYSPARPTPGLLLRGRLLWGIGVVAALILGFNALKVPPSPPIVASTSTAVPQPTASLKTPSSAAASKSPLRTFASPFAYCSEARSAEWPIRDYSGPYDLDKLLEPLVAGAGAALWELAWRCLDGQVLACVYTPYGNPCVKAIPPSQAVVRYCKDNPNDTSTNAGIDGGANFECKNGIPKRKAPASIDAQGYDPAEWAIMNPNGGFKDEPGEFGYQNPSGADLRTTQTAAAGGMSASRLQTSIQSFLLASYVGGELADVERIRRIYADRVTYWDRGTVSIAYVIRDKVTYAKHWTSISYKLILGSLNVRALADDGYDVRFDLRYDLSNAKKDARGLAHTHLHLSPMAEDEYKITLEEGNAVPDQ